MSRVAIYVYFRNNATAVKPCLDSILNQNGKVPIVVVIGVGFDSSLEDDTYTTVRNYVFDYYNSVGYESRVNFRFMAFETVDEERAFEIMSHLQLTEPVSNVIKVAGSNAIPPSAVEEAVTGGELADNNAKPEVV